LTDTNKQNSTGKYKQTQYKSEKSKQPKIQQNKTTLVQLPLTTLGQETRWAYSTTPPSPQKYQKVFETYQLNLSAEKNASTDNLYSE